MLDIGWTELLTIALLTIIVVGPKDLPRVLRTIGQWTAKARSITREFQNSIDDMARQADVDDIKQELNATAYNNIGTLDNVIDPSGSAERLFDLPETASSGSTPETVSTENVADSSASVAVTGEGEAVIKAVPDGTGGSEPEVANQSGQPAGEEPQRQVGP